MTPEKPAQDGAWNRPEIAFDYGQVAEDLAGELRQSACVIREAIQLQAHSIVQVGEILIETKAKLPHGQFLAWAEAECGVTRRSAQRYMKVAKMMASKSDIVSLFEPTSLYLLAAAPDEVRQEVLDHAAAGKIIPQADIKGMIAFVKDDRRHEKLRAEATADAREPGVLSLAAAGQTLQGQAAANPETTADAQRGAIHDLITLLESSTYRAAPLPQPERVDAVREVARLLGVKITIAEANDQPVEEAPVVDPDEADERENSQDAAPPAPVVDPDERENSQDAAPPAPVVDPDEADAGELPAPVAEAVADAADAIEPVDLDTTDPEAIGKRIGGDLASSAFAANRKPPTPAEIGQELGRRAGHLSPVQSNIAYLAAKNEAARVWVQVQGGAK